MYTDFKKNNLKPSTIDFNFNRNKNKNTHPVMEENILKVNLKFMMKVLLNRMTRPVSRYHTHSMRLHCVLAGTGRLLILYRY